MTVEITQQENGNYTIKIGNETLTNIPRGYMVRLRNALNAEISK